MAKTASTFFRDALVRRVRQNIDRYPWAKQTAERLIETARPWREMDNDTLWGLMFGPTITRSWMVWSSGYCPNCKNPVPMYGWIITPLKHPWKVQCPHCKKLFPTNDFGAYYRSGLNEQGVFDPTRADRSLLFNTAHPDPADPLYRFGVDDGEGYVEGDKRWRFIGAYLVYGQWKGVVLAGIRNLASAYLVTGDRVYARKAAILLDRVADLYPQFDHTKQAVVYETVRTEGYVSTWHDACEETRLMAMAYDAIFEGARQDEELVAFLSSKARQHSLPNPKATFADIHRNIEQGLLIDPLRNERKITSNFPRTPFAKAVLMAVQDYQRNRLDILQLLDEALERATAVDGNTGEKGLANYTALAVRAVGEIVATFDRADAGFLQRAIRRFPLRDTFRFHLDTWVCGQYYPLSGDTGVVAHRIEQYAGANFVALPAIGENVFAPDPLFFPSMFTFFWRLYELTSDVDFVRILYRANGSKVDGLPHDMLAEDPAEFQLAVKAVINQHGAEFRQESVNKRRWCIAVLRPGKEKACGVVWLDYDAGGGHGHFDAMNLGLFAHGLDLVPDFGYPPVQYGGWGSARTVWYASTAGHNTVVVGGKNQSHASGRCTMWHAGEGLQIVRASAPEVYRIPQYERTLMLVDIAPGQFYVLDIFRVVGGSTHDRFLHSTFSTVTCRHRRAETGIPPEYADSQMRHFTRLIGAEGDAPLEVEWLVEDRRGYLPRGKQVSLRCFDLTPGTERYLCEGWVSVSGFSGTEEAWLPRLMVRRRDREPLASTFVCVLVPYEGKRCPVEAVRRVPVLAQNGQAFGEAHVAVEVRLANGSVDRVVAMDVENPLQAQPRFVRGTRVVQPEWNLTTEEEVTLVRMGRGGRRLLEVSLSGEGKGV